MPVVHQARLQERSFARAGKCNTGSRSAVSVQVKNTHPGNSFGKLIQFIGGRGWGVGVAYLCPWGDGQGLWGKQDSCGHVQLAKTRVLEETSSAYSEAGGLGAGDTA